MGTASIYDVMTSRREVNANQRAWKYIRDLNEVTAGDLNKTAIIDGKKTPMAKCLENGSATPRSFPLWA